VKARKDLALLGGAIFATVTTLRLQPVDIDALVRRKLFQVDAQLRERFAQWDAWPADAQMGALSMAWAMGAGKFATFPRFSTAANARNFAAAASECEMGPRVGTIVARNRRNRECFEAAGRVIASGGDPELLCWQLA
jgi:hypothetical protein